MSLRRLSLLAGACALAVGLELAGLEQALAYAAPVMALALPLLADRYPGSAFLVARLEGRSRARFVRATPVLPHRTLLLRLLPRGARLTAGPLAGRGPPLACPPHP